MDIILFFDGVCIMCNRLVAFVLKHDKKGIIMFAPLQGKTARACLSKKVVEAKNTVVLLDSNGIYTESEAIIRLLVSLGGPFRLAWLLKIFPKIVRDCVYGWVSKNRYRWFGTTESCGMLTTKEKSRILN